MPPRLSPSLRFQCLQKRNYSTPLTPNPSSSSPSPSPSRWLTTTKSRLGKCITFGLSPSQLQRTSVLLGVLGREWRELVAGREGYLTDRKNAGILRRRVVWGEMDSMGHVNNVIYVRYAETARVEWLNRFAKEGEKRKEWKGLMTPNGEGLILKSIKTDYKFPMTWPDHISVFHKLRNPPTENDTSFILDVMILSELHQRPAARCVEDIVVYDYRIAKPVVLPSFVREAFVRAFDEQELARERNEKRIIEIEDEVRRLEVESWDRADAKEDFGSAGGGAP